jgi:hypothetical protein
MLYDTHIKSNMTGLVLKTNAGSHSVGSSFDSRLETDYHGRDPGFPKSPQTNSPDAYPSILRYNNNLSLDFLQFSSRLNVV